MRITSITALAGVVLMSVSAMAADWPQFRGPDANAIAPESGLNKDWKAQAPKELWRVALTDQGYGGPSVADGKVYIIDHRGAQDVVRSLNLTTGEELWTFPYPDAQGPNNGFTRATPTVNDGKVYTVSMQGKVFCLDATTGKDIWRVDMVKDMGGQPPQWGYGSSVVIDGEKALVTPGGEGGALAAIDRKTGEKLWSSPADKAGYSTPVIATLNNVRQYVAFSGTMVGGYSTDDGKRLWSFPWKTSYDVSASAPLVIGDSVFISTGYGTGCAMIDVTREGATQKWRNKSIQQHFSSAILFDGMIYSTTDPGDLLCLDPATGKEAWRQKGGFEKGAIVAADGVLLALSGNTGELVMVSLKPDACEELGRIKPLGGQSWAAPIIADGKVLVRNNQNMTCLSLK